MRGVVLRGRRPFLRLAVAGAIVALAVLPHGAGAQSGEARIRAQREELDRVRRERDALESRVKELQGRAHSLSDEVATLHRQREVAARLVRSLDEQLLTIAAEVDSATARLAAAEHDLANRKTLMRRRVRDIYKRGPLYSTEALLSAASFGELVARYKYLYELAIRDRAMVSRMAELYDRVDAERETLMRLRGEFERSRAERADEEQRLRGLEQDRGRSLAAVRQSAKQTEQRLARIRRDEARLADVIASFEAARKRAEARPNSTGPTTSTLRTSDFGKLDWPVDGQILYSFGRQVNPNNTAIRWNGVGIAAPTGTPVRAIAAGEVMVAEPIGTYGLTVIVQHGGGDYSVYGSLATAAVAKGSKVAKGQAVGTVGVSDPELQPHLHLEIRPKGRAIDPLAWLRKSAGR